MKISLILLVAISVAAAETNREPIEQSYLGAKDEFADTSAELQSINSYLTSVGSISMDTQEIKQHIEGALAAVNSVRQGVELDMSESHVRCLLGNNLDSLETLMDRLIGSSEVCNQETIEFLSLVTNHTFKGQILHSYSERLMGICQGVQAGLMADKVEKALSKMNSEIYDLMADLAQAYTTLERKASASRGSIVISDNRRSADPKETVRTLKQVKLNSATQQQLFVTIVRKYYAEEFSAEGDNKVSAEVTRDRLRNFFIDALITPCNELTERWTKTIAYSTGMGLTKRRLAETLDARRESNISLDQAIEMVRICRKLQEKSSLILSSVEK